MAARGLRLATLKRRLASIAHLHRAAAVPDPTKADEVRLRLRAICRAIGSKQRQARPLSYVDARRIAGALPDTPAGRRDLALILIGRDGLLRRSELVALDVGDLEVQPDGSALLHIRRSKTDATGAGVALYVSAQAAEAVAAWCALAGIEAGPIFRRVRRGNRIGGQLDAGSVTAIFRRAAAAAGLKVDGLTSHSCRVGAAVDLAEFGATLPEIMTCGRWKSPITAGRYCAGQEARRGAMSRFHASK